MDAGLLERDEVPWDSSELSRAEWEQAAAALPATTDADLVAALSGPAHEMDLALLASIDPAGLSDPLDRVAYLQALDRVGGLVASLRADAVVGLRRRGLHGRVPDGGAPRAGARRRHPGVALRRGP